MMAKMKCIDRPPEVEDNLLWDLLSKLLEFDPEKRITAEEALQYQYFIGLEAAANISPEQQELAKQAAYSELEGDIIIDKIDKDPTFIIAESEMKKLLQSQNPQYPLQDQTNIKQGKENDEDISDDEQLKLAMQISLQDKQQEPQL
ncbi:MAG: hypothetical protein EZS28_012186, partial [Streblomastix strix]